MDNIILLLGIQGVILGLGNGVSPGPVTSVIVLNSINKNFSSGLLTALTPVIAGAPIVAGTIFLGSEIIENDNILSYIQVIGGLVLLLLGFYSIKSSFKKMENKSKQTVGMAPALLLTVFNPAPYLFWTLVGLPLYKRYETLSSAALTLFFVTFFISLFLGGAFYAVLANEVKKRGNSLIIDNVNSVLGFLIIILGAKTIYEVF